jgi:hypothetical protein
MVVAGVLFAGFLVKAHLKASRLRSGEEAAYALLVRLAAERGELPLVRGGYRFYVAEDAVAARPERPGEDGARWFVTRDGGTTLSYDTVMNALSPGSVPDVPAAARYLKNPEPDDWPHGWRLVDPNTMSR